MENRKILNLNEILLCLNISRQLFYKTYIHTNSKERKGIFRKIGRGLYSVDSNEFRRLKKLYAERKRYFNRKT